MRPPREQDTVAAILAYLRLRGHLAWRINTGAFTATYQGTRRFHRFGVLGMSDLLGVVDGPGRVLAIEVKRPGRGPTPAQRAFLAQVTRAGGLAFVAHSLDDVKGHGL